MSCSADFGGRMVNEWYFWIDLIITINFVSGRVYYSLAINTLEKQLSIFLGRCTLKCLLLYWESNVNTDCYWTVCYSNSLEA